MKMLRLKVGTVIPMVGLVLVALACKKEEPAVPTTPTPDAGATQPVVVASAPTTTTTAAAPVTGPCDGAVTLALRTAIDTLAKKDLGATMKTDGDTVCMQLAEGQTVTAPFSFQPGGCYSFIAYAFPNVTEVEVRVKPDLGNPANNPIAAMLGNFTGAIDSDTGPSAVIGRKQDCVKHPGGLVAIPIAAKAEVVAKNGSGPVAIQVYRK
jgi:hypothetical protein